MVHEVAGALWGEDHLGAVVAGRVSERLFQAMTREWGKMVMSALAPEKPFSV